LLSEASIRLFPKLAAHFPTAPEQPTSNTPVPPIGD
jgi:hypothetical protein